MRRWRFLRTLRARLTVSHLIAMLVVTTVYATIVSTLIVRNASQSLDDRLRNDFRWAAAMAQQNPDGRLTWFEGDERPENNPWLSVSNSAGEIVYRTTVAIRSPVPESDWLADNADGSVAVVPHDVTPFRIVSGQANIAGQPVVIQLGRSEFFMREELAEFFFVLILGLPLSVAVTSLAGYWLARRSLTPLERMTKHAQAITADSLDERLPIDDPGDEIGRLGNAFNALLDRLEGSFQKARQFTSDVSHELRTPLTVIRSVGEVGLRGDRDATDYRTIVGSMLEEVNRLTDLVDRLLTLSRSDTGSLKLKAETVELGELADGIVSDLKVLAEEKNQTLSVERVDSALCVADAVVLRQALVNIVDNAIKYSPNNSQIRIRTFTVGDRSSFEVQDTGPGIPPDLQQHIFDRFYRYDPNASKNIGVGLGLAIARSSVEANGGELVCESVAGEGSCFRVQLPRISSPTKPEGCR